MRAVRTYHSAEASEEVVEAVTSGSGEILVAAYNAPDEIKARADFVCDGTDDQVEINQACSFGGGGLPVRLSPGFFNVGATVTLTGALRGSGKWLTYVSAVGNGTFPYVFEGDFYLQGTVLSDLTIDESGYSGSALSAARYIKTVERVDISIGTPGSGLWDCRIIRDCVIQYATGGNGILARASSLAGEACAAVENNLIDTFDSSAGLYVNAQTPNCWVEGNVFDCHWDPGASGIAYSDTGGSHVVGTGNLIVGVRSESNSSTLVDVWSHFVGNSVFDGGGFGAFHSGYMLESFEGFVAYNQFTQERTADSAVTFDLVEKSHFIANDVTFVGNSSTGSVARVVSGEVFVSGNSVSGGSVVNLELASSSLGAIVSHNVFEPLPPSSSMPVIKISADDAFLRGNIIQGVDAAFSAVFRTETGATDNKIVGNQLRDVNAGVPTFSHSGTGTASSWPNGSYGDNWRD